MNVHEITVKGLVKSAAVQISMLMLRKLVRDRTVRFGILLICRGIAEQRRRYPAIDSGREVPHHLR